jgi:RNA 2',3'-cyclic 3'-phosphodiesterase
MTDPELVQPIRAFIALPLPAEWSERLLEIARALQRRLPPHAVRWTRPDQMHLTLRFLGYLPPEQVTDLDAVLQGVGGCHAGFHLRRDRLGCFPDPKNPRVVWLGLAGDCEVLGLLQSQLVRETQPWGDHSESRPFHPHLTLGRVNPLTPELKRRLAERLEDLPLPEFPDWEVRSFELMRSELRPEGARHTILAEIPLGIGQK